PVGGRRVLGRSGFGARSVAGARSVVGARSVAGRSVAGRSVAGRSVVGRSVAGPSLLAPSLLAPSLLARSSSTTARATQPVASLRDASGPKRSLRLITATGGSPWTCPATITTGTPASSASSTTPPTALP